MSYTTRLLTDHLDRAMPRRHQLVLAAVVLWVCAGAIFGTLASYRTPAQLQPRIAEKAVILVIATPSPAPAQPTWTPAPTPAPMIVYIEAPTAEPQYIYVQQDASTITTGVTVEAQPAEEWHPPMVADTSDICATWHAPMVYPPECEQATQLPMPQQAVR